MTRRTQDRRYRSTAELIRAVRDEHLITQAQLAARAGLSGAQLSRYERGHVEPGHEVLRRLLGAVGQAPTYGVEPSTAALDEQLDAAADGFWYRVGLSSWSLVHRLVWPLVDAGLPVVVGGELAAVCHGVPVPRPELVVHLRREAVAALRPVVAAARAGLATADGRGVDPADLPTECELAVRAGVDTVRVLVSDTVPASTAVAVARYAHDDTDLLRVPAVALAELVAGGALRPTALALTTRFAAAAG